MPFAKSRLSRALQAAGQGVPGGRRGPGLTEQPLSRICQGGIQGHLPRPAPALASGSLPQSGPDGAAQPGGFRVRQERPPPAAPAGTSPRGSAEGLRGLGGSGDTSRLPGSESCLSCRTAANRKKPQKQPTQANKKKKNQEKTTKKYLPEQKESVKLGLEAPPPRPRTSRPGIGGIRRLLQRFSFSIFFRCPRAGPGVAPPERGGCEGASSSTAVF